MADHYNTFITDYDLETLKNAHIHSVRIPISYNAFLSEANRTDKFPHGEKKALDMYYPSYENMLISDSCNESWTTI
jgi:aryl-phospho-beta-D-glucosidase BglC (GH1 family)